LGFLKRGFGKRGEGARMVVVALWGEGSEEKRAVLVFIEKEHQAFRPVVLWAVGHWSLCQYYLLLFFPSLALCQYVISFGE
jgi:hypothetical protein